MVANKKIMARNIRKQMDIKGVTAKEVCDILGFKKSTFYDWLNGKVYPRIDKIEMMANYFNVSKADLVEDLPQPYSAATYNMDPEADYIAAARAFYEKYLSADLKTRRMIDILLDEGDE